MIKITVLADFIFSNRINAKGNDNSMYVAFRLLCFAIVGCKIDI